MWSTLGRETVRSVKPASLSLGTWSEAREYRLCKTNQSWSRWCRRQCIEGQGYASPGRGGAVVRIQSSKVVEKLLELFEIRETRSPSSLCPSLSQHEIPGATPMSWGSMVSIVTVNWDTCVSSERFLTDWLLRGSVFKMKFPWKSPAVLHVTQEQSWWVWEMPPVCRWYLNI